MMSSRQQIELIRESTSETMGIKTDNKWRPLAALADLPEKAQKEFEYIDGDSIYDLRFVKYKGVWYDAMDTQRITISTYRMGLAMLVAKDHPFAKWSAFISDSFFSGVLFKFDEDFEQVIVGRYCS